ncbi:MAG: hypothetical protein MUF71_14355 [Candidatus Kapabacteria bacterium]|jgi:hypothetical protein|nr:hypothetical protein [Candidatus Kapabacteria bacterium]
MKRFSSLFLLAIAALTLNFTVASAQDDKLNQFSFEDVPTEEAKPPYFAVSGGFISTWLFANVADLNTLTNSVVGANFNSPFVLLGGEAFAAIGIIPNVRVGIMSIGGTNTLQSASAGSQPTRQAEYSINMLGLSLDYAWTPFKGFSLIPGVRGGTGAINYEISQSASATQAYPIFPIASTSNSMRRLRSNMLFVMPNLNIEYAFTLVSMVRLNVGYNVSFMQDWRADNVSTITGVPASINATGLTAQVGLFVGLFNN